MKKAKFEREIDVLKDIRVLLSLMARQQKIIVNYIKSQEEEKQRNLIK